MSLGRRRIAVLGVAAALVAGVAVAAVARTEGPDKVSKTVSVEVGDFVDAYGIQIAMRTSFDGDVTLSAARASVAGVTDDAQLWPLDDVDHQGEDLDPLELPAGTPVSMSALVRPPFPGDKNGELAFQVRVKHDDGQVELVRFLARDSDAVGPALEKWCSRGPWVGLSHAELWPDGTATVYLWVSNPGPETVRVEVPAYADEHAVWKAATPQDVAPGEMADIEIHGTDVDCDDGETGSWQRGRLLLDGDPTRVQSWGDSYCG